MPQVLAAEQLFDGTSLRDGFALIVQDSLVQDIVPLANVPGTDVFPGVIVPGFVDLQVNGGGGLMLGQADTLDDLRTILKAHASLGATTILPTLITDTPETTRRVLALAQEAARSKVPGCAGLHLEGPHLDRRRAGAHDPGLIRPMAAEDLALYLEAAQDLRLKITLAPEAVTSEQIRALAAAGVCVSLGHSDARFERAQQAFQAGASCVTHLFNAMSPLGHRAAGMVGAALTTDGLRVGLIADGEHVTPPALRIAAAVKPDDLFLVSDAMAVAGTDLRQFDLQGRSIHRSEGRLTLADGTLAGADLDLARAVRTMVDQAGVPLDAALAMATARPAEVMGLRAGRLRPGDPADVVHLTPKGALAGVWQGGAQVR